MMNSMVNVNDIQKDYIDFGFIHCIDEASDYRTMEKNGIIDYLLRLKKQGVVHHIGLSSHVEQMERMEKINAYFAQSE